MADVVLQSTGLPASPSPWPTVDPFLFCVHHHDAYPNGDHRCGPAAVLDGRQLGSDFSGRDGWSMYHGLVVPGFPAHPHRGFETVTYARQGLIDHSDSLGATGRFGRGDVQWMTAGRGIQHSEMFPLVDEADTNPTELFQIWLNLPAADKMVEPHFAMLWSPGIPTVHLRDDEGRTSTITVIAGSLDGHTPPSPPPSSWASRPEADVAIWHVVLDPGASAELPAAAGPDTIRTLYTFEGAGITVDGETVAANTATVVRADVGVTITSGGAAASEVLVLQGRPIGEPVAQYGPFVMNSRAEIDQAFQDYQRTRFGGWPWDRDDPINGRSSGRFARHADGRVEEVPVG